MYDRLTKLACLLLFSLCSMFTVGCCCIHVSHRIQLFYWWCGHCILGCCQGGREGPLQGYRREKPIRSPITDSGTDVNMELKNAAGVVELDKVVNLLENSPVISHTESGVDMKESDVEIDDKDETLSDGSGSDTCARGNVGTSKRKCCTPD